MPNIHQDESSSLYSDTTSVPACITTRRHVNKHGRQKYNFRATPEVTTFLIPIVMTMGNHRQLYNEGKGARVDVWIGALPPLYSCPCMKLYKAMKKGTKDGNRKQEAQGATYRTPEYNAPPFWGIGQGNKCCCFSARSAQGRIQGGAKICQRGSPSSRNFFFRPEGYSDKPNG